MIHSILVLGDALTLLFARYWDGTTDEQQAKCEEVIAKALASEWARAETGSTIAIELSDTVLVCRKLGAVSVAATGSDEHDELALSELLDIMEGIIADSAGSGKKLTEESVHDNHGKLSVCIDDLIIDGYVYTTDLATVLRLSKHKQLPNPKTKK